MNLPALLLSILLAGAPGAWIAFTLASATPFSTRLGLSLALSPFVVGAQVVAAAWIGVDFFWAAAIAVLVNAPAIWLMWRARPPRPFDRQWLVPILCILVLGGGLAALWAAAPNLRIYSWHNMMQLEAVYQAAQLPRVPEEMGLAGVRLNYAWFGQVQIAAIARLADASPLMVFPVINLAVLAGFFLLALDSVRRLVVDRVAVAALMTSAALLSTNFGGILWGYLHGSEGAGDIRISTPLHKFLHFDLMTVGFALMFGVMALALASLDRRSLGLRAALLAALSALGLIYPLLFPTAFMIAGAAIVARPVCDLWNGRGLRLSRADLVDAAALALPLAVWILYLRFLSDGVASVAGDPAELWQIRRRIFDGALKASALWLPLLAFAAWRVVKLREPKRLALLAAGAGSALLYLVSILPAHVEYKFMVAAMMCWLPLVVEQAVVWLDRLGKAAAPAAAALAALMLLAIVPHIVGRHVPWTLIRHAGPVDEAHFVIAPAPGADAWTAAVRSRTPPDTVVVHPLLLTPVEVFAQRSAYIAYDGDTARPGYTMLARGVLQDVKGYPVEILNHRTAVLDAVYGGGGQDYAALDAEFASLQRPVAFYLAHDNGYLAWLRTHDDGRQIYADATGVVWLTGLRRASRQSLSAASDGSTENSK